MAGSVARNVVDTVSAGNNCINMSTSNNDNSRVGEKKSASSFCSFGGGFRQHSSDSETKRIMCNRRRRKVTPIAFTSNGLSTSPTSVLQQDTSCSSTAADTKSTMSNSYGSSSSASSSSRIRSRYLHRLGVVGPITAIPTTSSSSATQSSIVNNVRTEAKSSSSSRPLHRITLSVSTTEALKDGSSKEDQQSDEINLRNQPYSSLSCIQEEPASRAVSEPSSDQSSINQEDGEPQCDETASTSSHQSVVSFDSTVKVHFIPKRQEYSNRIKNSMWMDPQEMQLNAARNVLEFAAENWDWRQATEEKDMIIADDHTLVHPVHLHRQCNLQRQFLKIMSAQRQF